MRSAERRFTWALIAGGIATGLGAGHTDAPLYNVLVGLAWGVPVWIGTWAVLEWLSYLQEIRDEAGKPRPARPRGATVHVMYGRPDGEAKP
jgi:hypothetical protein